jgi:hypothetical protein
MVGDGGLRLRAPEARDWVVTGVLIVMWIGAVIIAAKWYGAAGAVVAAPGYAEVVRHGRTVSDQPVIRSPQRSVTPSGRGRLRAGEPAAARQGRPGRRTT